MEYLERCGIIHRDLAARNVLGKYVVRLMMRLRSVSMSHLQRLLCYVVRLTYVCTFSQCHVDRIVISVYSLFIHSFIVTADILKHFFKKSFPLVSGPLH